MKLLFASAEIYPYAKTGGLADVAQALPRALSTEIDVLSVMPLYNFIDRKKFHITSLHQPFRLRLSHETYFVSLYHGFNQGVETLFVYEPKLCAKKSPYGDEKGDYSDNDLRFGLFSKAIVMLAQIYSIDILHLNDWHTALAALWAREMAPELRTIFTIHNLAFQGIFPKTSMQRLGLGEDYFHSESMEYWGQINCMKAGIAYSDFITTVSPRYAIEILQPHFGCGLDGFLKAHQSKLYGILNGIDTQLFDPKHDPLLVANYSKDSLGDKRLNKHLLCQEQKLEHEEWALLIFIGRFTQQKGIDLIIQALPELLEMKLNLSIIGEGDLKIAKTLGAVAKKHNNFSIFFGYKESLSHQSYAAADFLLMPSSFEPCGLNQLISLRYGTMPIVHRVGGIYNTIRNLDDKDSNICGQGIMMKSFDSDALIKAVKRALLHYQSSEYFENTTKNNMQCDVSFLKSAESYLERYRSVL